MVLTNSCLSSFLRRYSFHPSIENTLFPLRLESKASNWLNSCLITMNLKPKVLLLESALYGNKRLNLFKNLIQFS